MLTTVVEPAATVCAVPAGMHTYTRWCTWWLSLRGGEVEVRRHHAPPQLALPHSKLQAARSCRLPSSAWQPESTTCQTDESSAPAHLMSKEFSTKSSMEVLFWALSRNRLPAAQQAIGWGGAKATGGRMSASPRSAAAQAIGYSSSAHARCQKDPLISHRQQPSSTTAG